MLVSVEVAEPDARRRHPFQLRGELATDVLRVQPPDQPARDNGPVRKGEGAALVDQGRNLPRAEQRRILTHDREVTARVERRVVAQHVRGQLEGPADGQQRRRGGDTVQVGLEHGPADASRQPQVVGRDDEQRRHSRARGGSAFSSPRSRVISPSIARITAGEDSVETPRVRGK